MNTFLRNLSYKRILLIVKPWLLFLIVILVLRFTGILSALSFVANTALMNIGVMDVEPNNIAVIQSFDYNFNIKDLNGKIIDFNTYKGKTIFINIWATWCGPCRVEMPTIQKLYDRVKKEEIIFVMLSVDAPKNHDKILQFISDNGFTLPIYQPVGSLPQQLDVPSIPTTFVISPEGKIVSKKVGVANFDTEKFERFLIRLNKK